MQTDISKFKVDRYILATIKCSEKSKKAIITDIKNNSGIIIRSRKIDKRTYYLLVSDKGWKKAKEYVKMYKDHYFTFYEDLEKFEIALEQRRAPYVTPKYSEYNP